MIGQNKVLNVNNNQTAIVGMEGQMRVEGMRRNKCTLGR